MGKELKKNMISNFFESALRKEMWKPSMFNIIIEYKKYFKLAQLSEQTNKIDRLLRYRIVRGKLDSLMEKERK